MQETMQMSKEEIALLRKEFNQIDKDGSGKIDYEEMDQFLLERGVEDDHRAQILQELFAKCDQDNSGKIEINEFVGHYVETKDKLVERESELKEQIVESHQKKEIAEKQLKQARNKFANQALPAGMLTIRLICAADLPISNQEACYVTLSQGIKSDQSSQCAGSDPNFKDQITRFEIEDESLPLLLSLCTSDGSQIIGSQIQLQSILQGQISNDEPLWVFANGEAFSHEDSARGPRLQVAVNYEVNEVSKWQNEFELWDSEIRNQVSLLRQVRIFIEQLRTPFGFLKRDISQIQTRLTAASSKDLREETEGDHKFFEQEKRAEAVFDSYSEQLARQYGVQTIPWLQMTKVSVWVLLGLTMFTMFKRPAMVSLTASTLALYILDNTDKIARQTFRGLVAILFLSWVYDLLYLFFFGPTLDEEDAEGAGMDYKLNRFVRLVSVILVFFKLLVCLIFWKDSLDFSRLVKGNRMKDSGYQDQDKNEFENIFKAYSTEV